jgi:hypothetical protein
MNAHYVTRPLSGAAASCAAAASSSSLALPNELVVLGVGTDPEPDDIVAFSSGQGSVAETDAGRPHARYALDWLKAEAWMPRIRHEPPIGLASSLLDVVRQRRE